MMTTKAILDEVTRRGLRLEARGDKLAVIPACNCQAEFADTLRAYKPKLMAWLEARAAGLPEDQAAWVYTARQIRNGEWTSATQSEWASIEIGLRSIDHPTCKAALAICRRALKAMRR